MRSAPEIRLNGKRPELSQRLLAFGMRTNARGCVKTPAFNLRVESSSHLVNLKTKSSGDGCSKRPIEKTVLRFLGSRTFSHGLAPHRSLSRTGWGRRAEKEQPFTLTAAAIR